MSTKNISILFTAILSVSMFFTSCKKDEVENPDAEEQELITTVKLTVTNDNGFNQTFSYKVENGFETPTPGLVTKDSIILDANTSYNVEINLLNENETPAENITSEVIAENHHHLFLYESDPSSGAGSVSFSDGDKDEDGLPFNQKIKFTTGNAGTGALTATLKHEPTNKAAATPAAAGGETDMEAVFNVRIK